MKTWFVVIALALATEVYALEGECADGISGSPED